MKAHKGPCLRYWWHGARLACRLDRGDGGVGTAQGIERDWNALANEHRRRSLCRMSERAAADVWRPTASALGHDQ